MEIYRVDCKGAPEAQGVVIVIDVIRAFSVAAYAFAKGLSRLWLVRTVDEARALRQKEPEALLAGEIRGCLIEGFDFNNSPSCMAAANVYARLLIQRTGAGTQGAVNAVNARHLLLCSLTNAKATASYARMLAGSSDGLVTLFPTEAYEEEHLRNEDDICADYLEALLLQRNKANAILVEGIAYLQASGRFNEFEAGHPDFPFEDIEAILSADRFAFAMVGTSKKWRDITYVDVRRVDLDPTLL